jgi:sigma-E factor negative regulatory protein RseB
MLLFQRLEQVLFNNSLSRLTLSLVGVLVSCAALASEDISAVLKKMAIADDALNYQGIFILRKSDNLISMRVEHGADERGVWESMESLNGEDRKIIRHNDEVYSYYPDRKLLTLSHNLSKKSLHPSVPENFDELQSYYKISRLKNDRIANRSTLVLDVNPDDKFRYGYRYWLDDETGVLLKCDLLNESGNVVEQMMFTKMDYLPEVPKAAFSDIDQTGYTLKQLDKARTEIQDSGWLVDKLPAGFKLTQTTSRKSDDAESLHLVYSDGLASVSVFIEPDAKGYHHLEGPSSMGALNAYGTRIDDHYVTVMGEVPANTVMRFAKSARQVASQDDARPDDTRPDDK